MIRDTKRDGPLIRAAKEIVHSWRKPLLSKMKRVIPRSHRIVIHSLVSCLTNEKILERKEKSKGLSASFGIAGRICKIVLRRLCRRRCVRKALLLKRLRLLKLSRSARRFVVEWSHAGILVVKRILPM